MQKSNMKSKVQHEVGYLKLSLQKLRKTEKMLADKAHMRVSIEQRFEEPWKILFEDNVATLSKYFVMQCSPSDHLNFRIESENIVGFSKFKMEKLCNIPRVRHSLEIQLVHKEKFQKEKVVEVLGILEVEALYLIGQIGTLEFLMVEAKLERDTQLIGDMDPYIRMTYDGVQYRTGIRNNEGKNPRWNQKIQLPVKSVKSALVLEVWDQDNISDDLVGSKAIDLLKQGLLRPSKELQTRPIYIFYEGKAAGTVLLESRFLLDKS